MATTSVCAFRLDDLLEEVLTCLATLSIKEAEILWDINEISRPMNGTKRENVHSSSTEEKLTDLLNLLYSFQDELRTIIQGLQEVKKVSLLKQIHWFQLLDEAKIVKMKICLAIVTNSACYNYKSKECSVPQLILPKVELIVPQPPIDHPIFHHYSLKQSFLAVATNQNNPMSSIIQIRSGGKVLKDSNGHDQQNIGQNSLSVIKLALDFDEKFKEGSKIKVVENEKVNPVLQPSNVNECNNSNLETKYSCLQNICLGLDTSVAPITLDDLISEDLEESFSISSVSKSCESNLLEIPCKITVALREVLAKLNNTFQKLDLTEKKFQSSSPSENIENALSQMNMIDDDS